MTRDERFQSLYRKHYRRMVRFYVRSFRLAEEDAEELSQEAFLRFYQALDEYRGEAEWAFFETIARNVAYNRVRSRNTLRRRVETVHLEDPSVREPAAAAEPDYADRELEAGRRHRLYDAIALLPSGQRQCLHLWLEDFKFHEIAKALRISVDAVKSRLRDARRLLRARLGDADTLPEEEE